MNVDTVNQTPDYRGNSDTPVTDRARRLAEDALDTASETAGSFERSVRHEGKRVGREVDERRREISEQLDQTLADVEGYIRKRPVAAAGMAFAAGLLTALILRR